MKLKGHITILFDHDGLSVEIEDVNSGCRIVRAGLDRKQTCQALSRLACTDCTIEVSDRLELVGKKEEIDKLEFPLGLTGYPVTDREEWALREVSKYCPIGWIPDNYYGSRDSFFQKVNSLDWWARVTIRRWI
jgi:hypothetical protein